MMRLGLTSVRGRVSRNTAFSHTAITSGYTYADLDATLARTSLTNTRAPLWAEPPTELAPDVQHDVGVLGTRARHRDDAAVEVLALELGVALEGEVLFRGGMDQGCRGQALLSD